MGGQSGYQAEDVLADCDDEAALVAAAQADPAAFGILYRHYLPQLYRYLRSRSSTDDEAADLTQQVFLRALEALPAYQRRGLPFAAWLFRIARNALIDTQRRERSLVPWQMLPEAEHPVADVSPHDVMSDFDAMIAPLDDSQREMFILRFIVGLPTREIAAVIGKNDGAVRMQISRSLKLLREVSRVE